MGLVTDLELQGNQFANASTFFFVAYLIAELPTGKIARPNLGHVRTRMLTPMQVLS